MRNIRLDICYDGTKYRGWQRQSGNSNTIQGKLESTLSRILDEPIEVHASGRTDAGVHALHQNLNFHCHSTLSCTEILQQLRRYLPEDIGIYYCHEASERFHARLNAREKTYRYRVWNSMNPCIFDRRFVTVDLREVDISAMQEAAGYLLGTHDFSAFCANKHMKKSTIRTITRLEVVRIGEEIHFTVSGNGFLHNMVRILVGTLMEVGEGIRSPQSMVTLFGADRAMAGALMPPAGLCLMEVVY